MLWLTLKVAIPSAALAWVCIWLTQRGKPIELIIFLGAAFAAMILVVSYSNYKREQRLFENWDTRGSRQLVSGTAETKESILRPAHASRQPKHMPLDFLKPEPLKLSELPMDQDAQINFTAITVDLDGSTWVNVDEPLREKANFMSVTVCPVEGGYRLTLPKKREGEPQLTFTPRQRPRIMQTYAPVVEIVEL